jgi:TatD DNase family protein
MILVDTHCHLYLPEFDADRNSMLQRAKDSGISKFYLPNIDSSVVESMLKMEADFPEQCFPMMGLHPCSVKENYHEELSLIEQWFAKRTFVAVGEIGLDFYWDKTFIQQQYDAFNKQMELALKYHVPIVIHSRDAMHECINEVKPFAAKGLRGVFHCFGDNLDSANEIISMGFYLGIGGVVTYKKSGLSEVLQHIQLDHIVLETDAPYLTPVPFRGKRNESSYITYVAEKIAEIKGMTIEEVASITTTNAEKLFSSNQNHQNG